MESKYRFIIEDLHLKYGFMQEIYEVILKDTVDSVQASNGLKIEEANIKSVMMQGLLDINQVIFKEVLVGADEALKHKASENKTSICNTYVEVKSGRKGEFNKRGSGCFGTRKAKDGICL